MTSTASGFDELRELRHSVSFDMAMDSPASPKDGTLIERHQP
jgi:hypothetical protein